MPGVTVHPLQGPACPCSQEEFSWWEQRLCWQSQAKGVKQVWWILDTPHRALSGFASGIPQQKGSGWYTLALW